MSLNSVWEVVRMRHIRNSLTIGVLAYGISLITGCANPGLGGIENNKVNNEKQDQLEDIIQPEKNMIRTTYSTEAGVDIHVLYESKEALDHVFQGLYWRSVQKDGKFIELSSEDFLRSIVPVVNQDITDGKDSILYISDAEARNFNEISFLQNQEEKMPEGYSAKFNKRKGFKMTEEPAKK